MLRPARVLALVLVLIAGACAGPSGKTAAVPPGPGQGVRLPGGVIPVAYSIAVVPDAPHMRFGGHVSITVEVAAPTRTIVLNAADLNLDRAALDGAPAAKVTLDPAAETARLDFGRTVQRGRHLLVIDYRGRINSGASGLFALDYDTPEGRKRMLVTQFENVDARRFVPCWDEPALKATFQLTVTAPQGQMAVSDMPQARVQALPGGLQRVAFQPTPRMSSYLLFLGVGDLERVSRTVDGVDVGVVVRRGSGDKAAYALDRASELLRYYDDYFGMRYPLPKLDLIGAPGAAGFGAMENWGAILLFEDSLLVDPKLTTQSDRKSVAATVAHEMAHQWFGDLVTMKWWDDVWLNESFANWMEAKSVDDLHPDWRIWLEEADGRERAMRLDATSATHPVVEPVETLDQLNEIPDAIVYDKGAAVVRMLEAYVGKDAWRDGVRAYLRAHAYGNATRADLWAAVAATAKRPVAGVAHDFTEQDGLPLVTAEVMVGQGKGSGLFLTEGRFGLDAGSKSPRAWRIPILARSLRGGQVAQATVRPGVLVYAVESPGPPPLIVNAGQVGYFRTLYSNSAFEPLAAGLARMEPADQLGLISDAWATGQAGQAPVARFMTLVARLPAGADPRVWVSVIESLSQIDDLYDGLPRQAAFRAWARRTLRPVMARVGWTPGSRTADDAAELRGALLVALGDFGDPDVVAGARQRFARIGQGKAGALSPEVREAVLSIVGRKADAAGFAALEAMATASADPQQTRLYLVALAGAEDPALAQRALELSLSPQTPATLGPVMIREVARRHAGLAWRFTLAHWAGIVPRLDPSQALNFAPRLLAGQADAASADALHAFALKAFAPGGRREADKAEAGIRQRAEARRLRLPEIDRWLNRPS